MRKICILLFVVFMAAENAAAQSVAQSRLEGEIEAEGNPDLSRLSVRLRAPGKAGPDETAHVEHDGRFAFRGLENGSYTLEVIDPAGNQVAWQPLNVTPMNSRVTVRLPGRPDVLPSGRTVSAARLMHPPGRQVLRDVAKAQKFAAAGSYERAAEQLEKAVAEDPLCAEAFNNLGVQYARLHRIGEAMVAFRQAAALDTASSVPRTNLAVLLARTGEFDRAETLAREGVRLDPANETARKILDSIVAARRQIREAALRP